METRSLRNDKEFDQLITQPCSQLGHIRLGNKSNDRLLIELYLSWQLLYGPGSPLLRFPKDRVDLSKQVCVCREPGALKPQAFRGRGEVTEG